MIVKTKFYNKQLQLLQKLTDMQTAISWDQISKYDSKCVCQTCTCHKHRCPNCQVHVPFQGYTSYQDDYHKHPINTWQKPPPEKAKPYQPYEDINSTYKNHYPGHKPQMRQKIVPRVKNQNTDTPFDGQSEYKNKFPGKYVPRDPVKIKDKQYVPDNQPFEGGSTYKSDYDKKKANPHDRRKPEQYDFPNGYKFNGNTTYKDDFIEKPFGPSKSCKPEESIGPKGEHDLNTIYRKDFDQKKMPDVCPILKMPARPSHVSKPNNHYFYSKTAKAWIQK